MCDPKKCKGCIQIYYSIGGWKPRMMAPVKDDPENLYCDVWTTGFPCKNSEHARKMGKMWAKDEGIPFNG